jgi:hypothetical protein
MSQRSDIYYTLGTAYARVGREQDATRARKTFRRLNAEAASNDGPNIYGDNPTIRVTADAHGDESGNQRP